MNKITIFLFFWLSFIHISLGQIATIRSYDGYSYSVGDTIQIGYPRYSSQNYDFILYVKNQYNVDFHKKLPKGNFPFTYAVIEKITPTAQNEVSSFTEKSPLLQVRSLEKDTTALFINLDYAIAQKELMRNRKHQQSEETALETHTLLAFHHKIHKEEITDDALLQYINSKDPELGKACNTNRFTFQKIRAEWQTAFEKEMASLDFNTVYFMEVPIRYSEYDFEKSGYWISFNPDLSEANKDVVEFTPYFFLLQNYTKKSFLPMQPDIAEKFETSQKGIDYYNWHGTLYARVFFMLSKDAVKFPKTDKGIAMSVIYGNNLMNVEIQKVDVFDHESYQYNYVGTIH